MFEILCAKFPHIPHACVAVFTSFAESCELTLEEACEALELYE